MGAWIQSIYGFLITGPGVVILLCSGMLAELTLPIIFNYEYIFGKFGIDEGNILTEVKQYANRAINFGAITFAGITFIVGQFRNNLELVSETLLLFVFGLALFLVSYKIGVIGGTRRLYWIIQQRLFNYGILSLVLGLLFFFYQAYSSFLFPIIGMSSLVVIIHLIEYMHDFDDLVNTIDDESCEQSQLCDF